jgi:oligopeptide transport system ATP-binding protein
VEQGPVRDIFHRTKHPYTRGLLAALPNPQCRGTELKMIPGSVPTLLKPIVGCPFASRCEFVMEICRQVQPPLYQVNNGHRVACHLWRGMPSPLHTGSSAGTTSDSRDRTGGQRP